MNTQEEKPNIPMTQSKTVLHHYLGTGLLVQFGTKEPFLRDLYADNVESAINSGLPALHSMNRLTMPLENGEVPLIELAKMCFPNEEWNVFQNQVHCKTMRFWYDEKNGFHLTGDVFRVNQLQLFQYLINNHFNCFGLSESEYIEK